VIIKGKCNENADVWIAARVIDVHTGLALASADYVDPSTMTVYDLASQTPTTNIKSGNATLLTHAAIFTDVASLPNNDARWTIDGTGPNISIVLLQADITAGSKFRAGRTYRAELTLNHVTTGYSDSYIIWELACGNALNTVT